jgi:hypothetical protein
MNTFFKETLLKSTEATDFKERELIQKLWSGYGKILRFDLEGAKQSSVVVKHVMVPGGLNHPRGWNTDLSHKRKLQSYQVEMEFYRRWSSNCSENCSVPKCYALETCEDEVLMILEDLDSTGFSVRKTSVNLRDIKACLKWLANFHATFMGEKPEGLWETGTYWHLATRPDELDALDDLDLKNAALAIDKKLGNSKFQTFVHGDAKLANFCFSPESNKVAAVDFQYVGGGCGMKDVAYFIGSCLYEDDCEELETELLDYYFECLSVALKQRGNLTYIGKIEEEWRPLYAVAWTDFHRFMKGWSPGHWKIHSYSERLAREVVALLKRELE